MVIDNKWTTIGSYNLNYLSHYRSIEMNVDTIDSTFAIGFTNHLSQIINTDCETISYADYEKNIDWFTKLKIFISYTSYELLMSLMLPRKRRKKEKII